MLNSSSRYRYAVGCQIIYINNIFAECIFHICHIRTRKKTKRMQKETITICSIFDTLFCSYPITYVFFMFGLNDDGSPIRHPTQKLADYKMHHIGKFEDLMTPSNGDIFRVSGPL